MKNKTILIAGGGIGGITAALCLAKSGFHVKILEQASEFGEVGAGIQQSPNATRVLHYLGLEEALLEKAFLPKAREIRDWRSGEMLLTFPLGDSIKQMYGFPYYHIHRADLIQVLAKATEIEENIEVEFNSKVIGLEQTLEEVEVRLSDGRKVLGGALVGADGIKSAVRESLFGSEQPHFTNMIAWRGLVPVDRLPEGLIRPVSSNWHGPGSHFVHYYVKSGILVNCVCVIEKEGWEVESWIERGDHAELKSDFKGWHETIQILIDNMDPDNCFKWALFDRDPLEQWSVGKVTLLGDACHATLPFMAQGAAMAIEDGAVLASCLAYSDKIEDALLRYESLRKERTAKIQNGSRRNAKVFHMRPSESEQRNADMKKAQGKGLAAQEWLFGYDALTIVNS